MTSISIKSVLAALSILIDDRYWNEAVMLEHASKGFLQLNLVAKLEPKNETVEITTHKGTIPSDLKFLNQAVYVKEQGSYIPMRASLNSFMLSICPHPDLVSCPACTYEYTISPSGVITTNFAEGSILLSYMAHPVDEEGDLLIPDDEVVKEAIVQYVLYQYWQTKYLMKEEGARERVDFHYGKWSVLSKKALSHNLPTLDVLENLKNIQGNLFLKKDSFGKLFSNLNQSS